MQFSNQSHSGPAENGSERCQLCGGTEAGGRGKHHPRTVRVRQLEPWNKCGSDDAGRHGEELRWDKGVQHTGGKFAAAALTGPTSDVWPAQWKGVSLWAVKIARSSSYFYWNTSRLSSLLLNMKIEPASRHAWWFSWGKKNTKSLPPTGDGELLPLCGGKLSLQSDLKEEKNSALFFITLMILYSLKILIMIICSNWVEIHRDEASALRQCLTSWLIWNLKIRK